MLRPRRWKLADADSRADSLAQSLKTSPLIAQILLNRGINELDQCQQFLSPNLKLLHEPNLIAGLTKASQRIALAIREKQKIVVYGDYDVDGITASSILWHAIRVLGGSVSYYIPHRIEEGYGLNSEAIAQLCDDGNQLIVTVDCGVTAVEPAKIARQRNVDLIITDHHEPHSGAELPDAYTIVHPHLPGPQGTYPNRFLCGAGVAFKLAWGIGQACNGTSKVSDEFRSFLLDATALAALGTIADVVPLVGENRVLAHFGLTGLKKSKLIGIRALIDSAGLEGKPLDSYDVGFLLAPRLNACGRMGHARLAVEMLTHADDAKAHEIATYLEQQNRARQGVEKKILEEALKQVTDLGMDKEDCRGIVLAGEGWHPGVIGIVASRIVDRFSKPTFMIALNDGLGQGSGRSIAGFHLAHALEHNTHLLESHGGHEMAAGLKIKAENLEEFREAFRHYASDKITPEMMIPQLHLEASAELRELTHSVVTELHRLGPFGHGNRKPVLCCKGVQVAAAPRRVGKTGDHLQLYIKQGNSSMKAIAFGAGDMADKLVAGTMIDLAVEPQINEWQGRSSVELEVKDVRVI